MAMVMTTKTAAKPAAKPARAYKHWKPDELQCLAEHYGLICDKTLAAHLQRKESAIINIASRKRLATRMANFYTAATLAKVLGIPCPKQVLWWVKRGWLKGRPSARSQGKKQLWRFSERGVVHCLKKHPWLVDINRMEEHYFRSVVIKEWERDPWYTVRQAAPLFGFTKLDAVYRYIHRGWLPAEKKPCHGSSGGVWIIRSSVIQAFLENDPRPRHKHIAASVARKRFIVASGSPLRLATIWVIKCPSCRQEITITAPPELGGPRVREMFIELYVNGNCKHGTDCLISLKPSDLVSLEGHAEEGSQRNVYQSPGGLIQPRDIQTG